MSADGEARPPGGAPGEIGGGPVILLFLDGVGLGKPDDAVNPFFRAHLPVWRNLLGGEPPWSGHPLLDASAVSASLRVAGGVRRAVRLFGLDAGLGVPGLPQSGTGQVSLLTGENAAALHGRHFGPWPPVALRPLLQSQNLFRQLRERGRRVSFANAYPAGYPSGVPSRRVAAPALAASMAGVLDRDPDALVRGDALASDIDNEAWRRYTGRGDIPSIGPAEAGRTLARIGAAGHFTLFAHYATDTAGHRGGMEGAVRALERVDAFLGSLLESIDDRVLVLIASDHGNIEDIGKGHTLNLALGLAAGPAERVEALPDLACLTEVAPAIVESVQDG